MDSLITAAARALATGDALGALKRVALRDDAPALALRGIAMAQLGDLVRAKTLLRSAARAFGPKEAMARARCVVAEADGLVSKARLGSDLYEAIRQVARGVRLLPVVPPSLAAGMRHRLDSEEQAIFGMLLAGIATPQIAVTLDLSHADLERRLSVMVRKVDRLTAVH